MRLAAPLLLLWSCAEAPAPPPQFVASSELGEFRLVDVTPRRVALRGGQARLSFAGATRDGGGFFYVVVGPGVSGAFDNIAGVVSPHPDGGPGVAEVSLPPRPAGSYDLSLMAETLEPDAGRLGALLKAIEYRSTPATPKLTPRQLTLGVPVRATLASPCARAQDFQLSNGGDEALSEMNVSTEGAGFSVTSNCGPALSSTGSCVVKVCFGSSSPGEHRGVLRVRAREGTASADLVATVQAPRPEFAWQVAGRGPWALSGTRVANLIEGTNSLALIDALGVVTTQVALAPREQLVGLAGDGAGAFGALIDLDGQRRLTAISESGVRERSVPITANGLFGLGRGRVVTNRGNELTAWSLATLSVDTSWAQSGRYTLAPGFLSSTAALVDGRLFLADGSTTTDLSPSGQVVVVHQQPARLVSATSNGVLISTGQVVLRWGSNAWGFVSMAPPGLSDLAVDEQDRLLLSLTTGTTERRRRDTLLDVVLPLGSIECSEAGFCVGVGLDGPDSFIGRVAD